MVRQPEPHTEEDRNDLQGRYTKLGRSTVRNVHVLLMRHA